MLFPNHQQSQAKQDMSAILVHAIPVSKFVPRCAQIQKSKAKRKQLSQRTCKFQQQRKTDTKPSIPQVSRRCAVAILGFTVLFEIRNGNGNGNWAKLIATAATSKMIRLKDVEDERMREALRAAVSGDLQRAEVAFSELIQEDPHNASLWSNRGSVRMSLNRFLDAAADLSQAIKLAPEASVPFFNRAIAYEALGRYQEAIEDCKSAIVNDPEESAAWFNLGNVDVKIEDYEGALAAYERASTLAPGIAGYLLREALVLFQLNRIDESRKLFEGLVRKYPNYAEAHAALAAIFWSNGIRNRAEDEFTKATVREPLFKDIRWVKSDLQWPPSIVQAMNNLISIS